MERLLVVHYSFAVQYGQESGPDDQYFGNS